MADPQRDPSTYAGGAAKDLSAGAVAAALVTVSLYFGALTPPIEVVLALQVLATVGLGFTRRLVEEWAARRGGSPGPGSPGTKPPPTATLGTIVALGAILAVGCASATITADGAVHATARGRSSVTVCQSVKTPVAPCIIVKGGAISQVFGDVLLAPFKLVAGALGGAAGAMGAPTPAP